MDPTQPFQLDDQTDEDFFDKLVGDDVDETNPEPAEISRVFSNLSIGNVEESESVETQKENSSKEDLLANKGTSSMVIDSAEGSLFVKGGASKGTSIREVQWSAFNVGSEQFGQEDGLNSDLLAENDDALDSKSSFLEDPVEDFSSYNQTTDQNDPQYWENLYPGWKYDHSTGQWHQLDGYQVDNSNALSSETQERSDNSVSGIADVSYLQTTSQSELQTIAEDCTTSSVGKWNQGSHGTLEYPPNMVFDPQYPEWYYDTITQQWYTLESYTQGNNCSLDSAVQEQPGQDADTLAAVSLAHSHSLKGNAIQTEQNSTQSQGIGELRGKWNSSESNYTQEKSLYLNGVQSEQQTSQVQNSKESGWNWGTSAANTSQNWISYNNCNKFEQNTSQGSGTQQFGGNWNTSMNNYSQPKMWQPESVSSNVNFISSQQLKSEIGQQTGFKPLEPVAKHNFPIANGMTGLHSFVPKESTYQIHQPKVEQTLEEHLSNSYYGEPVANCNYGSTNSMSGLHSFIPKESTYQSNKPKVEQTLQEHLSNSYYGNQNMSSYSQHSIQGANASYSQFPYASNEGRSSAGRPPHVLVAFGFGGKLIVMNNVNSFAAHLDAGTQGNAGGAVSILNLAEVVAEKTEGSGITGCGSCSYFHALCQQPFPGPLVGGNAAAKDVNKWIDERIVNCESSRMNYQKGKFLKLLLCLLKISCEHYGKLRSPFSADPSREEMDGPELAVTKLFASARKNGAHSREYGSFTHCIKNLPSEGQIKAAATEVQSLLVSGRRKEALEYAQEGQLWGPALVLASQLGEQFYVDTVKKMAHHQFVSGSPLRTLCLLIAGQPADIFSADNAANGIPGNAIQGSKEIPSNGMLDDWEENLAMITANRTKDDELVIIHLGDCLLKERGEITAAHTCYLVAEANFESFSDSARMCLIGADHWKCPRTFASPEAIRRTEVYEYSKVLGNSQFVLLPYQPYKLVYANMLAEVGKVSESLRYCQAALKLLKNPARTPEVEAWKTSLLSLEERLRTHQQGGYSSNMAPAKLVGKLFTSIDRSLHRMMGAPPAPPEPMSKENFSMTSSQSTMAMSSLMPSASVEAISEWSGGGNKKNMHSRSVSEPDFSRSPKKNSSKGAGADAQRKGGPSRFGLIGSELFQKTFGWVSRSRPDRQAKLGETNKFYYDEKLKRWVEEGAEPPAEEAALPPPPTSTAFHNGSSDYNINSALKTENLTTNGIREARSPVPSEPGSGIPPIPPSQNQFSARARMGVRSRYVDTFNKGGGSTCPSSTNSFQSLSPPSVKPAVGAKFFVPTAPAPSDTQTIDTSGEPTQKETSFNSPSASSPPRMPSSMQRFPSMDNLSSFENKESRAAARSTNGSSSHSRAASWGETYAPTLSNLKMAELGSSPPLLVPHRSNSSSSLQLNGDPLADELDEVTL